MEFKQIKELISIIDSTEILELEMENEGFKIRIRKERSVPGQIGERGREVPSEAVLDRSEPGLVFKGEKAPTLVEVRAPMVGTFYRASAPEARPYVLVGDVVAEGQVLFIIEAMKMMNEIEAEIGGTVKEILAENGKPVEYGEPLLLIEVAV